MTVSITKIANGPGWDLALRGNHIFIGDADLADLSAAAFSALCEMNTERMAATCTDCGHVLCECYVPAWNAAFNAPTKGEDA